MERVVHRSSFSDWRGCHSRAGHRRTAGPKLVSCSVNSDIGLQADEFRLVIPSKEFRHVVPVAPGKRGGPSRLDEGLPAFSPSLRILRRRYCAVRLAGAAGATEGGTAAPIHTTATGTTKFPSPRVSLASGERVFLSFSPAAPLLPSLSIPPQERPKPIAVLFY